MRLYTYSAGCDAILLRLKRVLSQTSQASSSLAAQQSHPARLYSSVRHSRSFSDVLEFATIQPANGRLTSLDFHLKAALVVNTASNCSYASQLTKLQTLHEKYRDQGLVVVAVPSNEFAGQEPGSRDDLLQRYAKFGVTFVVAEKTVVQGNLAHAFFKKIADIYSPSVAPTWNFDKFLVDHRGDMRAVFPNDTDPMANEVVAEIEEVLRDIPRELDTHKEDSEVD